MLQSPRQQEVMNAENIFPREKMSAVSKSKTVYLIASRAKHGKVGLQVTLQTRETLSMLPSSLCAQGSSLVIQLSLLKGEFATESKNTYLSFCLWCFLSI